MRPAAFFTRHGGFISFAIAFPAFLAGSSLLDNLLVGFAGGIAASHLITQFAVASS